MFNAAHVLEVALLLLAAFLVGAVTGSLLRSIAQLLHGPREIAPKSHVANRVPRIVPADPVAPMAIAPEATEAVAAAEAAPSETAAVVVEAAQEGVAEQVDTVEVTPVTEPADAAAELGAGASQQAEAAAPDGSEVNATAENVERVWIDADSTPPEPVSTEPATVEVSAPLPAPEVASGEHEQEAQPAAPDPTTKARPAVEEDEFAAMRAIEGNWTPRRRTPRTQPARKQPDAGTEAVATLETAEAAAPKAAEAEGRPRGLSAPRHDRKDNLTHVIGILPVIETSLNSLGIYHFDQIAEFSDANVDWLEAHLGIEGRIGREQWRQQARELALALRPKADVAG